MVNAPVDSPIVPGLWQKSHEIPSDRHEFAPVNPVYPVTFVRSDYTALQKSCSKAPEIYLERTL